MTYTVKYKLEINVHEIITDWMHEDGVIVSSIGFSDSKRPTVDATIAVFDSKEDALKFTEFFSQNNCHTKLKDARWEGSYCTIQDYHLYESVWIDELKTALDSYHPTQ